MALVYTGNQDRMTVTIGSNYTVADGSIVLTAGHGARLPATGDFWLKPTEEEIADGETYQVWKCTSRSTDTLTVTPAEDGTTDTNVASGVDLEWTLGEAALDQLRDDLVLRGAIASLPAAGKAGRIYLPTDSPYDVYDTGSEWIYRLGGIGEVVPPPSTGWSWDNQESATIDSSNGFEYIYAPRSGLGHASVRYRTDPSTPYFIEAGFLWNVHAIPPGANQSNRDVKFGIFLRDATAKLIAFVVGLDSTVFVYETRRWTDSLNPSTTHFLSASTNHDILAVLGSKSPIWLAVGDDGSTNLTFYWSIDKYHWELMDTWARTDFLASGPTQVGFGCYTGDSPNWEALIHWKDDGSIP